MELDVTSEKIGPKKHRHRAAKVNYILVVGENEAAENTLNVNGRDGERLGNMPMDKFLDVCRVEIATKGRADASDE